MQTRRVACLQTVRPSGSSSGGPLNYLDGQWAIAVLWRFRGRRLKGSRCVDRICRTSKYIRGIFRCQLYEGRQYCPRLVGIVVPAKAGTQKGGG